MTYLSILSAEIFRENWASDDTTSRFNVQFAEWSCGQIIMRQAFSYWYDSNSSNYVVRYQLN